MTTPAAAAVARRVLAALALAAALGGCTATGGGQTRAPDGLQGESGITVFGTVDMSVGTQRSR